MTPRRRLKKRLTGPFNVIIHDSGDGPTRALSTRNTLKATGFMRSGKGGPEVECHEMAFLAGSGEARVKIVDVKWARDANRVLVECVCGRIFWHHADRGAVSCPQCRNNGNLGVLRKRWAAENGEKDAF